MGRRKSNPFHKYFKLDDTKPAKHVYLCQCPLENGKLCLQQLKGEQGSNRERHVEKRHPKVFNEVKIKIAQKQNTGDTTSSDDEELVDSPQQHKKIRIVQSTLSNYAFEGKMLELKVRMSIQYIKEACLKTVTVDGRPFLAVEDDGYRDLLKPYLKAIEDITRRKFVITAKRVAHWVHQEAITVRKLISEKIKHRLIHLKVDVVTKHGRSFLGVNVQFCNDEGQLEIYCLSVKQITVPHNAKNLKEIILKILSKYGVDIENIYSFVCDNGANIVKTGRLLDYQSQSIPRRNVSAPTSSSNADEWDDLDEIEVEEFSDNDESSRDGTTNDTEALEANDFQIDSNLFNELAKVSFQVERNDNLIQTIRCAAHTLQLAVNDAYKHRTSTIKQNLKAQNVNQTTDESFGSIANIDIVDINDDSESENVRCNGDVIEVVRSVMKKLRTTNGSLQLLGLTNLKAIVDNDTRWMSTFDMIERCLQLKAEINTLGAKNEDFKIFISEWEEVLKLRDSLKPCKEATIKLQREIGDLRDLYRIWTTAILETKAIGYDFAKVLVKNLTERRAQLFKNVSFLSALYFEPCYKAVLGDESMKVVKDHSIAIGRRVKSLQINRENKKVDEGLGSQQAISHADLTNSDPQPSTSTASMSADSMPTSSQPVPDACVESEQSPNDTSVETDEFIRQVCLINTNIKQKRMNENVGSSKTDNCNAALTDADLEIQKFEDDIKKEWRVYESEEPIVDSSTIKACIETKATTFWLTKENRPRYPHLFEVVKVVAGVPSTQVSVERLFSGLDFILSKRRTSLSDESVDDIIVIRTNRNSKKSWLN